MCSTNVLHLREMHAEQELAMSTTAIRLSEAERRYAALAASGKAIPWSEMRRYLEDRIAGRAAARPAARKLAR